MSYTNFAKEISKFCRGHKCKAVQRVTTKVHLVFLFFALSSKSWNNVAFFSIDFLSITLKLNGVYFKRLNK